MSGAWVTIGNAGNFDATVIEASYDNAVLVDFWAEWCAPCRALAPVIDDLATQLDGSLRVVKVDTDAEPALAGEYGIRSLPTLVIFRDGKAVDQAIGVQPLGALRALVAPYLENTPADDLAEVRAAMADGNHAGAASALETALAKNAEDYRLHPLLADCYVALERFDDARALISSLPANIAVDHDVQRIVARLNLATAGEIEGDDDVAVAYREAVAMAVKGDFDAAVAALIALLAVQRDWQDDRIRKTLVDIFSVLGDDARLKVWRTKMARVLN